MMRMADAKEPGNVRRNCGNNNSINEQIQAVTCKVVRMRARTEWHKHVVPLAYGAGYNPVTRSSV